jgi:2-amino-4-hydroxy-6-hydroxymethyldihydropteridine diphosphokinase
MVTETVVILLGSDLEPRKEFIASAVSLLQQQVGILTKESGMYESEPWGFESDTRFLNKVVVLESELQAREVLKNCLDIEQALGRERKKDSGYASRTIDVDILYFGQKVLDEEDLQIPHPRLQERRFTLLPLREVLPGFLHPVLKKTQKELLEQCSDRSQVVLFKEKEDAL